MPKINEILLKVPGFQYDMSLDLNMGYYHIRLSKNASNSCKMILPWGKYWYKHLPMGVANSPVVFHQKINYLFHVFEFIRVYIDDMLFLTKGYWTYHAQKLELTINKLKGKNLNIILKILSSEKPKWNN